jgi:alpha-1,3-glucan synthase
MLIPNPDPSDIDLDIEALDEHAINTGDVQINTAAEALRPEHKRQAQEWALPSHGPFVFVGRWSKQKGVGLIVDVLPSLYVTFTG